MLERWIRPSVDADVGIEKPHHYQMGYSSPSREHLALLSQIKNIHTPNTAILPLGMYFKENLAWILKKMFMRRFIARLFVAVES